MDIEQSASVSLDCEITYDQARSQDFALADTEAARVHFFPTLVVAHIFGILEAHGTLLVDRTMLLY